jgi:hypothetical protein
MQRHEEPKAGGQPGDDWEQGTYVYFDHLLHDDGSGERGLCVVLFFYVRICACML